MIIWINGAFGAGKSQTAVELRRRSADAHAAHPARGGRALRRPRPPGARPGHFQDLASWRSAVVDILQQADAAHAGPVLVPMTVVRDDYLDEIVGGLRSRGVDVRHYALVASPETLRKRLRTRVTLGRSGLRRETWAVQQIPRCVAALAQEHYGTHVDTDDRTTDEVVEWIAADVGLTLEAPRLARWRYQVQRLTVALGYAR